MSLIGGLALLLPISQTPGSKVGFLDCWFTSTSAVCVTGLITVDTSKVWSTFGLVVIMLLIQLGGLGYMTMVAIWLMMLRNKLSYNDKSALAAGLNAFCVGDARSLFWSVVSFSILTEFVGWLVMIPSFAMHFNGDWHKAMWYSIYHTVSAFNNAGFSMFQTNLTEVAHRPWILFVISMLITIGGIGFFVIRDLISRIRNKTKLTLQTKIVLWTTSLILISVFVILMIFEWGNPETLKPFHGIDLLANTFLAAVTPRTAGFNSIDYAHITPVTYMVTLLEMFIGASPGGTGGGVKTTTFAVITLSLWAMLHNQERTIIKRRYINAYTLIRASSLVFLSMLLILGAVMIIDAYLNTSNIGPIIFEVVSAFGTVGLSQGITANLGLVGKLTIIIVMLAGRVGPITFGVALFESHKHSHIRYPEEKVLLG